MRRRFARSRSFAPKRSRAFASVAREDFVGRGPWQILRLPEVTRYETTPDADPRHLYENVLVALDPSRNLNNGEPAALARWLDALASGGRLLVPLTVELPMPEVGAGHLLRVVRGRRGYGARFVSPLGIFHCAGARTREGSDLLRGAYSHGDTREVASLRRDPHRADDQCWLHSERFCLSRLAVEEDF